MRLFSCAILIPPPQGRQYFTHFRYKESEAGKIQLALRQLVDLNVHSSLSFHLAINCSVVAQSLSRVQLFWNPMDCSPPGSSVRRILQARILEWVANCLLQVIFQTQGLNPCLLHWQADSLTLSYQGSPMGKLLQVNYFFRPSFLSCRIRGETVF